MLRPTINQLRRLIPLGQTLTENWSMRATDQKTVVFHFRFPMNFAVCKPLMRRLARDDRLRLSVCLQCPGDDENRRLITDMVQNEIGPLSVFDVDLLYASRFDLILSPIWELGFHQLPRLKRVQGIRKSLGLGSFKSVQLFHGLAEKNGAGVGTRELAEWFDYFFLLNRRSCRYYEELGIRAERLRLIGFGKLDQLARGDVDPSSLRQRLALRPGPVVLYAPTWEFVNDDPDLLEGVISRLALAPAQSVVKLHDLTYRRYDGSGFVECLQHKNPSVRFVRDADSNSCLALADLLISDMSSIAFEYLVLDRPLLFVETPEMATRFGTKSLEYELRQCGHIVKELDDLLDFIRRSLNDPLEKAGERRSVSAEVLFEPGTAVDRAAAEIYQLLGVEE
jgi:CDP-Glycerol:Poly(glycerophosphate) glycerophosphotransferase